MKRLTRRERAMLGAIDHALDHEPATRRLVIDDYRTPRRSSVIRVHQDRYQELMAAPGSDDPTGFAPGCVV